MELLWLSGQALLYLTSRVWIQVPVMTLVSKARYLQTMSSSFGWAKTAVPSGSFVVF